MRILKAMAGGVLSLALGWSAAHAAEPEVIEVGGRTSGAGCAAPPPCGCPTPGSQYPGGPGESSPDGMGTPGGPFAPGTNQGAQFGTDFGRSAMTDVPLHGDQFSSGLGTASTSFGSGAAGRSKPLVLFPTIRGFKITEDESPRPIDRVYIDFNYFDRVNESVLQHFGSDAYRINAYRETFGIEKTFLDGDMSIGFRLPINTLEVDSTFQELQSTNTALGDLSVILKFAPYNDKKTGDTASFGLAVTAPTGSTNFGGAEGFTGFHSTILEPFFGYIFHYKKLFVEGFEAISVPMDKNDAVLLYNDIGAGYLYSLGQPGEDRILTAIVPMVEMHLSDPLNHQGAFKADDPGGTADVLAFTAGVTFVIQRNVTVAMAVVAPVTGPRPFDLEAQFQLNWYFGAPKR
jgi:hypothetical protein